MRLNKGFTLIELIVVIAIVALLSFFLGAFIINTMDTYVFVKVREKGLSDMRLALNRMTRELKHIDEPQLILSMEATECEFVKVGTGVVDLRQIGTDLYLDSDILLSGLVSPEGLSFFYYDASGNPTSTAGDVRSIKVRLHVLRSGEEITLESRSKIRNE